MALDASDWLIDTPTFQSVTWRLTCGCIYRNTSNSFFVWQILKTSGWKLWTSMSLVQPWVQFPGASKFKVFFSNNYIQHWDVEPSNFPGRRHDLVVWRGMCRSTQNKSSTTWRCWNWSEWNLDQHRLTQSERWQISVLMLTGTKSLMFADKQIILRITPCSGVIITKTWFQSYRKYVDRAAKQSTNLTQVHQVCEEKQVQIRQTIVRSM